MAPKRIHTTIFPVLNPPKVVEDLERILRRGRIKADKGIFNLQMSLSLPTESVKSIENIILNKETDQSLLRSKSSSKLSQVIVGRERIKFSRLAQQPSQPSSKIRVPHSPIVHG